MFPALLLLSVSDFLAKLGGKKDFISELSMEEANIWEYPVFFTPAYASHFIIYKTFLKDSIIHVRLTDLTTQLLGLLSDCYKSSLLRWSLGLRAAGTQRTMHLPI